SRSAPVSSLKASATSSKNSVESGLVPSMIHTLRVCPSPIIPPLSPSPLGSAVPPSPFPPPHAASTRTAPAAIAPVQIFLIFPPRKVSARGPETLYHTLVDDEIYIQRGRRAPMRAQKRGPGRVLTPRPLSAGSAPLWVVTASVALRASGSRAPGRRARSRGLRPQTGSCLVRCPPSPAPPACPSASRSSPRATCACAASRSRGSRCRRPARTHLPSRAGG